MVPRRLTLLAGLLTLLWGCRSDIPQVLSDPAVDEALLAWEQAMEESTDAGAAAADEAPEEQPPVVYPQLVADDAPHSVQLRGARLGEALLLIADLAGLNLVLDGDFSQPVQISLPSVGLQQALVSLLDTYGCGVEVLGDVVRVQRTSPSSIHSRILTLSSARVADLTLPLATLVGDQQLVVDPARNVVMVNGSREDIQRAEAFLAAVDRPEPQVLIETRVLEVSRSDLLELGARIEHDALNVNNWTARFVSDLLSPTPQVLSTAATDTQSVDVTLDALQTLVDLQILQRPRLLALHGQEARLEILQELPYIDATTTTESSTGNVGSQTIQEVEFKNVGLELAITPTIQGDGLVGLRVVQRISVQTGVFNDIPVVDSRNIETSFQVRDGETIVMGGLMQNSQRARTEAVPLLGDLPLVGQLFRNDRDERGALELVLLMTPRIVETSGAGR